MHILFGGKRRRVLKKRTKKWIWDEFEIKCSCSFMANSKISYLLCVMWTILTKKSVAKVYYD